MVFFVTKNIIHSNLYIILYIPIQRHIHVDTILSIHRGMLNKIFPVPV